MKTNRFLIAAVLMLAAVPLFAASDYLLKIDTIPGESTAPGHPGWIEIESWSWGASTPNAAAGFQGGCSSNSAMFSKKTDRTSPALMQAASSGTPIPSLTVEVRGERHMLQNIVLKQGQKQQMGDGSVRESFSMNFTRCATHAQGAVNDVSKKVTVKLSPFVKGESNGTLTVAGGPADAIALQDFHFLGPNKAQMKLGKFAKGVAQVGLGVAAMQRSFQTRQKLPSLALKAKKAGSQEYFQVTLTDVLISSYQTGADSDQVVIDFARLDGAMANFSDVFIK